VEVEIVSVLPWRRRKTIMVSRIDLEQQYRQEQSVVWPKPPANDC
jgi:hypothetical protein